MADLDLIANDPDLAPLWQAVHNRLSAGKTSADIATVTVPVLTPNGVAALRSWLDTPAQRRRGRTLVPHTPNGHKVPLRPLLAALDLPVDQLQPFVESAVGHKVVNRREDRLESAQLRQNLWDHAATQLPHLPMLLARLKAAGLDNDAAPQTRRLIDALCALTRELPHRRPRTLAKLAHDHAGDRVHLDAGDRETAQGQDEREGEPDGHRDPAPAGPGRQQQGRDGEHEDRRGGGLDLADGARHRGAGPVGHGEPRRDQAVRQPVNRVRGGRGRPHRSYPRLALRTDRPEHRALHVVPPARVHHRRPAGVREQQPALAGHRDQGQIGHPRRAARQERRLVQRQVVPVRLPGADRRGAHGGQAQPRARYAGRGPGRQQEKDPEHGVFLCEVRGGRHALFTMWTERCGSVTFRSAR